MTLEDDKRMVAEWMGWTYCPVSCGFKRKNPAAHIYISDYNPQDPKQATYAQWAEIFGRMGIIERVTYLKFLRGFKSFGNPFCENWFFHTTPPDIMWKALVTTIKDKE